jgi:fermentation-respiration switch protein FrsA (DUF1100 family)
MRLDRRIANLFIVATLLLTGCASEIRQEVYQPKPGGIVISEWTKSKPEELKVATADGYALQGFYWPGATGDHDIIVFFHGRGAHQGVAAKYAEYFTGRGDGVLVASYRGFGGNPGSPSEAGLIADGRAFVQKAKALAGKDAHVFVVGHSLGGAVALQVALREKVAGVVTLSTFTELDDASPSYVGPLLPDHWRNLAAVKALSAPLVLVHGTADDVVPVAQARTLFAAAHRPAALVLIEGATHKPSMGKLGPLVSDAVEAVDADALARFPAKLPKGWSAERK